MTRKANPQEAGNVPSNIELDHVEELYAKTTIGLKFNGMIEDRRLRQREAETITEVTQKRYCK